MSATVTAKHLEAARKHLISDPTLGRDRLAQLLNISRDQARRLLKRIRRDMPPVVQAARAVPINGSPSEVNEIRDDHWDITINATRICTLEQLVAHCKVDRSVWEVERFVVNKWEVGAKNASGEIIVEPLFQVKAWLKKKVASVAIRAEVDAMLAEIRNKAVRYAPIKRAAAPTGNMLELSFPDLHIGKLAWGQETGWGDYDSKIAEQVFRDAFAAILQGTGHIKYDKVLLVIGNDLLNADNSENTTAGGTPQSCDTRQAKSFRIARRLNEWAIEQARLIAPVDVLMVAGNHDTSTVFFLGEVLDAKFDKCTDVTINNEPTARKFYQWGKVGLMFTHKGGKGERDAQRNRLVMAVEDRKMWGDTLFNEIHTGDLHQVRMEEQFGVRVRILPSLCKPDAWHASNRFVGNLQSAEAYSWNRDTGLFNIAYYTVPENR